MQNSYKWQTFRKWAFVFFVFLIITSFILYLILKDSFSVENVRNVISNFGIWAPVFFILLFAIGTAFIPSTPFMAVAGILFGFKYGLIYSFTGGILSSIVTFAISRNLGREWVETVLQKSYMKKLDGYNRRLAEGAIYDLIILRVFPFMPFNVLNILMGISRISTSDYIIGTTIGLIPSKIIAVYAGTILVKLF